MSVLGSVGWLVELPVTATSSDFVSHSHYSAPPVLAFCLFVFVLCLDLLSHESSEVWPKEAEGFAQHKRTSTKLARSSILRGHSFTYPAEIQGQFDPLPSFLKFFLQSHQVKGVQTVYNGGTNLGVLSKHCSRVAFLRYRFELILAPGILDVAIPGMLNHLYKQEPVTHGPDM